MLGMCCLSYNALIGPFYPSYLLYHYLHVYTTTHVVGPIVARCMKQVNTIDIYEEYFEGKEEI